MASDSKNEVYEQEGGSSGRISRVLGLGLVSAASAVAGGLAVAWWYRKTLAKLQNPIASAELQRPELPEVYEESYLPEE